MPETTDQTVLTAAGLDKLKAELKDLQDNRRPSVLARIKEAISYGDLSENSEYEDAKNEQAFMEGEIQRLEAILASAQIIEEGASKGVVSAGSRVTIVEKGSKDPEVYMLVGSAEANPGEGKISVDSPMGRALMGHKTGAKVTVKAPDGDFVVTIKKIE